MREVTRGLGCNDYEGIFDPLSPWWRPAMKDKRLRRATEDRDVFSHGRRMTHPFLEDLVYSRVPDRTVNMASDTLPRAEAVVTKTLDGSAVTRFDEFLDDIIVREIWLAQTLSTLTDMFRHFQHYWTSKLPPGRYLGWQPRDLTPKRYAIEILRVDCGEADGEYMIESLGREPGMMRVQLAVTFKTIYEVGSPSSVVVATGA